MSALSKQASATQMRQSNFPVGCLWPGRTQWIKNSAEHRTRMWPWSTGLLLLRRSFHSKPTCCTTLRGCSIWRSKLRFRWCSYPPASPVKRSWWDVWLLTLQRFWTKGPFPKKRPGSFPSVLSKVRPWPSEFYPCGEGHLLWSRWNWIWINSRTHSIMQDYRQEAGRKLEFSQQWFLHLQTKG